MGEKIHWTLNVQVVGGPKISASKTENVEAYDKIDVEIEAGNPQEIQVQPGDSGQVKFLLISSDRYASPAEGTPDLSYQVNGGETAIKLDAPQLLIGDGAVGLLGAPPKRLTFTNNLDEKVSIKILVGRMAAPKTE